MRVAPFPDCQAMGRDLPSAIIRLFASPGTSILCCSPSNSYLSIGYQRNCTDLCCQMKQGISWKNTLNFLIGVFCCSCCSRGLLALLFFFFFYFFVRGFSKNMFFPHLCLPPSSQPQDHITFRKHNSLAAWQIFILPRASTQELCLLSLSTSKRQYWYWIPVCFIFLYWPCLYFPKRGYTICSQVCN